MKNIFALSKEQKRMWLEWKMSLASDSYQICLCLRLKGVLDLDRLEKAILLLINHYPGMRTKFVEQSDSVFQCIMPEEQDTQKYFCFKDLSSEFKCYDEKEKDLLVKKKIKDLLVNISPLDYPLVRFVCAKYSEHKYVFLACTHHILYDILSDDLLICGLSEAYNSGFISTPSDQMQYLQDCLSLEGSRDNKADFDLAKKYWTNYLQDVELSVTLGDQNISSYEDQECQKSFILSERIANKIYEFIRKHRITLFVFFISVLGILLRKYTQEKNIVLKYSVNIRPKGYRGLYGFFVNNLPLKLSFDKETTFLRMISEVRTQRKEQHQYQWYSLIDIVQDLRDRGKPIDPGSFNVEVAQRQFGCDNLNLDGIVGECIDLGEQFAKSDLQFLFGTSNGNIDCAFTFKRRLFSDDLMNSIRDNFLVAIERLIENSNEFLDQVELISQDEIKRISLYGHSRNEVIPSNHIGILINQAFDLYRSHTALVSDAGNVSYEELDILTTKVAAFLQSKVPAGSVIAVMMNKSVDSVAVILGILKADCTYVPISVNTPDERLEYILKESNAKLLFASHPPRINTSVEVILDLQKEIFSLENKSFSEPHYASDLAFIIYTSGSTGIPKGVLCDHRSVINRLNWNWHHYPFENDAVCCLQSNLTFVDSTWDIFGTLLQGKKLVVYNDDVSKDISAIMDYAIRYGINRITLIPSLVRELIDSEMVKSKFSRSNLRHIELTGESFDFRLVNDLFSIKPNLKVVLDCYGATEATSVIYRDFSASRAEQYKTYILSNTSLYILDSSLKRVPVGAIGELYIGGESLSAGYINNPQLTAAKFIQNPFDPKSRLYKTGDLARFNNTGNIEILGRSDNQVKIRGFRVELHEIENAIQSLYEIKHAIVALKGKEGQARKLVGYIVLREGADEKQSTQKIREVCVQKLPDYMRPSQLVFLDNLPLSVSGKIDRKALPEPDERAGMSDFEEPEGEDEQILAIFWKSVLGVQKVSRNDNFFLLGGNSILIAKLSHKIAEWRRIEIPLKLFFECPTLKEQAMLLARNEIISKEVTVLPKHNARFNLSFSQKRLWIIHKLLGNNALYNIPYAFKLKGKLNRQRLRQSLQALIHRHEMLNVVFLEDENGNVQQQINFDTVVVEEKNLDAKADLTALLSRESEHVFNLNGEKLVRVTIFDLGNDEVVVLFVVHHVLADGWSINVIAHELVHLYNGDELPEITGHYEDYIQWQDDMLLNSTTKKSIQYWRDNLKDAPESLKLPFDFIRPTQMNYSGGNISFNISNELFEQLQKFLTDQGVTLFMFMFAAIGTVLHRYSRQDDIVLGTPVANRPNNSFENVVGFFSNTLALRLIFNQNDSLLDTIKKVKKLTLDAYDHQYVPFDYLIDCLNPERRLNVNPVFQVMVTVEERDRLPKFNDGLVIEELKTGYSFAKFDLEFEVIKCSGQIEVNLLYSQELFTDETIQELKNSLINFIKNGLQCPNSKLDSIDLLSTEEQNKIAYSWNDTKKSYDDISTVCSMFEISALRNPTSIALKSGSRTITYQELLSLVNAFAAYFKLAPNIKRVAVIAEKSVELVALILGLFKSGKVYIPIDPSCPISRLEYMLNDSNANMLVLDGVSSGNFDKLNLKNLKICSLSQIQTAIRDENVVSMNESIRSLPRFEDEAYVIYTSGTTGTPKGVVISHRNLAYRIKGLQSLYPITSSDIFLSQASFCFDAAFEEWLLPLTIAAHVLLVTKSELLDGLAKIEGFNDVTVLNFTPMFLQQLLEFNQIAISDKIKCIIVGGDVLNNELINLIYEGKSQGFRLFNTYGPTETTIDATYHEVHKGELDVPIGKPLENTQAFILNSEMRLNPVGVAGELFLGGECVSSGYLNNTELNEEKFVKSPFHFDEVLYRTGDLCRYRRDGSIEYLGRIDNQIKLRGLRIELDEVKSILMSCSQVCDASVVLKCEDTEQALVAYVVPTSNKGLEVSMTLTDTMGENIEVYRGHAAKQFTQDIINKLSQNLSSYMIPSYFVILNKLPLNQNAKLDTKFLRQFEISNDRQSDVDEEKLGNLQTKLKGIFQNILGGKEISTSDDFFKVGGDSLKAIKLAAELNRVFSVNLKTSDIFLNKTVNSLIPLLLEYKKQRETDVVRLTKHSENLPLLFMVHPGERGCEVYVDLAKAMASHFNCYGVDSFNLYNSQRIVSIHELAEHYLRQITEINKTDRCQLLGWCFGGQICFEMATIIERENLYKEVELYLLNTFIFDDYLEKLYKEEIEDVKKKGNLSLEESLTIVEMAMQCQRPLTKLKRTKIVLFKTGTFEKDNLVMQHVIKLSTNNLERYVTEKENIVTLTLPNTIHTTIISGFEKYFRDSCGDLTYDRVW